MRVEQKKSKLIEDLVYQNGQLNCKLSQKNIKIAERIKNLAIMMRDSESLSLKLFLKKEIDWLMELADI